MTDKNRTGRDRSGAQSDRDGGKDVHQRSKGDETMTTGSSGILLVVWNPEVVVPTDYADLITALGDLVRSVGGRGVHRIGHRECEISVGESAAV